MDNTEFAAIVSLGISIEELEAAIACYLDNGHVRADISATFRNLISRTPIEGEETLMRILNEFKTGNTRGSKGEKNGQISGKN
jgi:hypothetical protein